MNFAPRTNSASRHRAVALIGASWFFLSGLFAAANRVTYQVNLSGQRALGNFHPADGDTVVVSGTFSTTDWTTTATLTVSASDSNLYIGPSTTTSPRAARSITSSSSIPVAIVPPVSWQGVR